MKDSLPKLKNNSQSQQNFFPAKLKPVTFKKPQTSLQASLYSPPATASVGQSQFLKAYST